MGGGAAMCRFGIKAPRLSSHSNLGHDEDSFLLVNEEESERGGAQSFTQQQKKVEEGERGARSKADGARWLGVGVGTMFGFWVLGCHLGCMTERIDELIDGTLDGGCGCAGREWVWGLGMGWSRPDRWLGWARGLPLHWALGRTRRTKNNLKK